MSHAAHGNRNIRYRFPVLLYMVFLFFLSSMPGLPPYTVTMPNLDKILHLLIYAGFGVTLLRLFSTSPRQGIARQAIPLAILAGTLYGAIDEWHQSFIPGRDASLLDAASDSLGCMLAATLYRPLCRQSGSSGRTGRREERGLT